MSKRDLVVSKKSLIPLSTGFGLGAFEGGFRLLECGYLRDMRNWKFAGLQSPLWRCYCHSSSGSSIRIDRHIEAFTAREVVFIPENTQFDCFGAAGVSQYWIHFCPPVSIAVTGVIRVPLDSVLKGLVQSWCSLVPRHEKKPPPHDHRILAHATLALLHACFARSLPPAPTTGPSVQILLEEIERTLSQPIDNAALARLTGRSLGNFSRWFRKVIGVTPARYRAERRMREGARRLVVSEHSIDKIAEDLGFANRHHFSRVFTRYVGESPARFRVVQRSSRV